MENTNNYSNKPIGEWKIGDKDYFISFALTKKPNWFRRVMAWLFFGLRWIDYPQPKELEDIKPSKGIKRGITKVVPKGRR
jgi:hypothetical protein